MESKWKRCSGCGIYIKYDDPLSICRSCELKGVRTQLVVINEVHVGSFLEKDDWVCMYCNTSNNHVEKICSHCSAPRHRKNGLGYGGIK